MKNILFIWIACLQTLNSIAQSAAGITGQRDTSYTVYSAYASTRKSHPDIKIAGELAEGLYSKKKGIAYCKRNERELMLDVFSPKQEGKAKRTAVIIIHGGGWRSGTRDLHYPLAQQLASLGYVCFTPEYRLSTEALYPAAVYDIKAAIRWVREHADQFQVDTSRVAVAGHSAGGELAAMMGATNGKSRFEGIGCAAKFSSHVNAVINIDGIVAFLHPESGEGDDSKRTSAATYWLGYSKKENPELWKEASPLTHAGAHTPPVLFLNSSVERMHAGRNDFIKLLGRFKIYTEVKTFEGSPHSFCLFDPWFEPTVKHIDQFLTAVFKK